MATVGGLVINLALNTVGLSAGLAKAEAQLAAFQAQLTGKTVASAGGFPVIAAAAAAAGLAILGVGVASTRAATQFEYEMRLIQTQAGATTDEVNTMSESLLNLAPSVQQGPEELAKGLFHIESVGIRSADALNVLKVAAQGAAVGNANLEDVTNALIAAQLSGIKGVDDMSAAMGTLNGIVGTGNLRMADLATSLSSGILSTAKSFGLSIQDVGAALATMADQGIPAEEASTRLRITIALLGAPTKLAADQLASIGLTQRSLADEMRGPNGLIGALRLLKDHMDRAGLDATAQAQLLKTAFGGSRSSSGLLTLINSLDLMDKKLVVIKAKSASFADDFAAESETARARFDNLGAAVGVLAVRIGNALLPIAVPLAQVLGEIAKQTWLIVPAFLAVTAAITVMAVKAFIGLIAGLLSTISNIAMAVIGSRILQGAFTGLTLDTDLLAGSFSLLDEAIVATAPAFAAAEALAASTAGTLLTLDAAAATSAGTMGALVTGIAGADGVMTAFVPTAGAVVTTLDAMAVSTGPLVVGLMGADGAIAATAAAAGGLVLGLAGADGAMVATTEAAGPLVAGLVGVDGAQLAITESAGPLIGGLSAETVVMNEAAAAAARLAAAEEAVGLGAGAVGAAAVPATAAVGGLAGVVGALALPITIAAAAIALLLLNFDKVGQGVRVVEYYLFGLQETWLRFQANFSIGPMADGLRAQADAIHAMQQQVQNDAADMQKHIDDQQKAGGADAMSSFIAGYQSQLGAVTDLNATLIQLFGSSLAGVEAAAMQSGATAMDDMAKGILAEQNAPVDAFKTLKEMLLNEMTPTKEIARLIGELSSTELAQGLASQDPAAVAAAEALRKHIVDRLNEITDGAYSAGTAAGGAWVNAYADAQAKADKKAGGPSRMYEPRDMNAAQAAYNRLGNIWKNQFAPSAASATKALNDLEESLKKGDITAQQAAETFASKFSGSLKMISRLGKTAGTDMMLATAKAIEANSQKPLDALADLHTQMKNAQTKNAQIAFLLASLNGQMIANGLKSKLPAARAAAEAAVKVIEDQLDALTNGAFSAGQNTAQNFLAGLTFRLHLAQGHANSQAIQTLLGQVTVAQKAVNNWPTMGLTTKELADGVKSYTKWLKELDAQAKKTGGSLAGLAAAAKSALTSAFDAIKASAHKYFDKLHEDNLRAINDIHDQKNALLDAKEALIQKPVTAAQKALDFQRQQQEEARLRAAIQNAADPQSRRDAIAALQDFLAQKHIDEMQAEVDSEDAVLEAEKKANDDQLAEQVKAEDARYAQQKKDFDRELAALERHLKTHPKEWKKVHAEILALMAKFGVNYKDAGELLGAAFVKGLKSQIAAAQHAAQELAKAGKPKTSTSSSNKTPQGLSGVWDLANDTLYQLHAREMVLTPSVASNLRPLLGGYGMDSIVPLVSAGIDAQRRSSASRGAMGRPTGAAQRVVAVAPPFSPRNDDSGGGTIVFMVGNEKLDEITDRRLRVRGTIYRPSAPPVGSLR